MHSNGTLFLNFHLTLFLPEGLGSCLKPNSFSTHQFCSRCNFSIFSHLRYPYSSSYNDSKCGPASIPLSLLSSASSDLLNPDEPFFKMFLSSVCLIPILLPQVKLKHFSHLSSCSHNRFCLSPFSFQSKHKINHLKEAFCAILLKNSSAVQVSYQRLAFCLFFTEKKDYRKP